MEILMGIIGVLIAVVLLQQELLGRAHERTLREILDLLKKGRAP